ncbi:hypothetical protein [Metabacillus bambusae]|uniref:Uncharacterized protein n=1 Tax=Metabacillus bambusae TaxID=2795218 RepID=A0ABS3N493_9BACI|nr:hypothetical protein [Metabacillus bambusae]MBO1513019.1 hypothetical protein [Metabacillus bambusae]
MRVFMFLMILTILTVLVASIDAFIYKSDLITEILKILSFAPGTNKWMVYIFLFIGFIYPIVAGIKGKLQKNGMKS